MLFLLQLLCSFDGACLTSASYPARLLVVRGWWWWWQLVVMVKGSWYGERESADYAPVMSRQLLERSARGARLVTTRPVGS